MRIQKIEIKNFKSIYDELTLDFNDINGFWKISGEVGSGKTTLGEAIIYGLFGSINGKNNSDLISWGQKHAYIKLWCNSLGHNLYIKRELNIHGQSPIYVEIDGEELIFTNKRNAQAQLENEYYDTTRVMVELLCIISFNNFKSLATLNTKDTKLFLDRILGFSILTRYSEICKQLKLDNVLKINELKNNIEQISSQIKKLQEISNMDIIEGDINETKQIIKDIQNNINEYKGRIKKQIDGINKEIQTKNNELTSIITLGKNKAKEIKLIEGGICPTCGATIDKSQLDIKKREKDILMESYSDKLKQINDLKAQLTDFNNQIDIYLANNEPNLKDNREKLIRLEEQTKRLNISINEIQNLENQKDVIEKSLNKLSKDDQEWTQLYNYLTITIRQQILDTFIPNLNKNILDYTQQLQQPYIIQFDNEFNCFIKLNGFDENIIPISSLSTGQLKTVDMIIILGVLKSIINNSNLNIMFLDELFSNLDNDLRNKMCNILKNSLLPNNTLFIISHQDLDDKYFDGNINIWLENFDNFKKKSKFDISKL